MTLHRRKNRSVLEKCPDAASLFGEVVIRRSPVVRAQRKFDTLPTDFAKRSLALRKSLEQNPLGNLEKPIPGLGRVLDDKPVISFSYDSKTHAFSPANKNDSPDILSQIKSGVKLRSVTKPLEGNTGVGRVLHKSNHSSDISIPVKKKHYSSKTLPTKKIGRPFLLDEIQNSGIKLKKTPKPVVKSHVNSEYTKNCLIKSPQSNFRSPVSANDDTVSPYRREVEFCDKGLDVKSLGKSQIVQVDLIHNHTQTNPQNISGVPLKGLKSCATQSEMPHIRHQHSQHDGPGRKEEEAQSVLNLSTVNKATQCCIQRKTVDKDIQSVLRTKAMNKDVQCADRESRKNCGVQQTFATTEAAIQYDQFKSFDKHCQTYTKLDKVLTTSMHIPPNLASPGFSVSANSNCTVCPILPLPKLHFFLCPFFIN